MVVESRSQDSLESKMTLGVEYFISELPSIARDNVYRCARTNIHGDKEIHLSKPSVQKALVRGAHSEGQDNVRKIAGFETYSSHISMPCVPNRISFGLCFIYHCVGRVAQVDLPQVRCK